MRKFELIDDNKRAIYLIYSMVLDKVEPHFKTIESEQIEPNFQSTNTFDPTLP